jgi:Beta-lactamase enzyme family
LLAGVAAAVLATLAALASTGSGAAAAMPCLVPGVGEAIEQTWKPDIPAAVGYAHTRTGDIAFAVRTDHKLWGYRQDHQEWSASVVKAMLMVAYLDQGSVAGRDLNGSDRGLLEPMITVSDNNAAQQVFDIVGQGGLQALAHRVGMTNFATDPVWGKTHITASDQTKFFLHIDSYIAAKHRGYAMHLLASVTPSQRWGVGEVAPKGWNLYFKGGWGYGTGLLDHQVALFTRGCARVSIAVLTMFDGSHPYGKDTLKGLFSRLLNGGLPTMPQSWELPTTNVKRGQPIDKPAH